jgi:hypothetical protein
MASCFGKAVDERMWTSALCSAKARAHDKHLHTDELTQTALDRAGAPLLTIWPELMVEALGVLDYLPALPSPFCSLYHSLPALADEPRTYQYTSTSPSGVVLLSL